MVESRRDDMPVGATVSGFLCWQEYCLADDSLLEAPLTVLPDPLPGPESAFLGALGHTGVTAYIGIDLAEVGEGDTVVISAACGAVGSIAGQVAKQRGARVVGIAGGPEKCEHAVSVLGYDACVDHRSGTGAPSSTPPRPTASTSTSRTSAARSWTTSSAASTSAPASPSAA